MSYYTATFLVGTHWFGVPFPKLQTFSRIFWVPPVNYSLYEKTIRNVFLFVYLGSCNNKSKFSVFQTVQSSCNTSYLQMSHFCEKCWYFFLALIFLNPLKKNPIEKLCDILEMKLKKYTHSWPKIHFWESQI